MNNVGENKIKGILSTFGRFLLDSGYQQETSINETLPKGSGDLGHMFDSNLNVIL